MSDEDVVEWLISLKDQSGDVLSADTEVVEHLPPPTPLLVQGEQVDEVSVCSSDDKLLGFDNLDGLDSDLRVLEEAVRLNARGYELLQAILDRERAIADQLAAEWFAARQSLRSVGVIMIESTALAAYSKARREGTHA